MGLVFTPDEPPADDPETPGRLDTPPDRAVDLPNGTRREMAVHRREEYLSMPMVSNPIVDVAMQERLAQMQIPSFPTPLRRETMELFALALGRIPPVRMRLWERPAGRGMSYALDTVRAMLIPQSPRPALESMPWDSGDEDDELPDLIDIERIEE